MWVLNAEGEPEGTLIPDSFLAGEGFDDKGETMHLS